MAFDPIRGSHAIMETIFYVQLAPQIRAESLKRIIEQTNSENDYLKKCLPKREEMKAVKVAIGENGATTVEHDAQTMGVELSRILPNGEVDWVMRIQSDAISVHCLNYSRWDSVWPEARSFILSALARVPDGTAILAIGLKNIDKFLYGGDIGKYNISDLIRENSKLLPPHIYQMGHTWHSHSGWFENTAVPRHDSTEHLNVLHQLNIDAAPHVRPAGQVPSVAVDHNILLRASSPGQFVSDEKNHEWLDIMMGKFHIRNKEVMAELLSDRMLSRINLQVEVAQ